MATMKRILSAFIVLFVLATSSLAATEALQIDALWSGLMNSTNGKAYSGAIIATFAADGSTPKAVWENKEKTQPSALGKAQFTLDSSGAAEVFGDGVYVIKVYAPTDTLLTSPLRTIDGLTYLNTSDGSILGVSSITSLRAGSGGDFDGQVKTLLGYYSDGDRGGGDFYWDELSTETDNSGTIIKVASIATGRWIRITNTGSISVRWFGVHGDGTDSTTEILNVWAYIVAANNSDLGLTNPDSTNLALYFPEGVYSATDILLQVEGAGYTVYGDGMSSRLDGIGFHLGSTSRARFTGLYLRGTGTYGFLLNDVGSGNANYNIFSDISISNKTYAIYLNGSAFSNFVNILCNSNDFGLYVELSWGDHFTNCEFNSSVIDGIRTLRALELKMVNCRAISNFGYGLRILGTDLVQNLQNYYIGCSFTTQKTTREYDISAIVNDGSGNIQVTTTGAHELASGMIDIDISGTANYDSTSEVLSVIDATNFVLDTAYIADEATGNINLKNWDVFIESSSTDPARVTDVWFTGGNINYLKVSKAFNVSFKNTSLQHEIWIGTGCNRILFDRSGRGRHSTTYTDLAISGAATGWSDISNKDDTHSTTPGSGYLNFEAEGNSVQIGDVGVKATVLYSGSATIADDGFYSFTPPNNTGVMVFSDGTGINTWGAMVSFNTNTPIVYEFGYLGANVELTTGALNGTTGTDAKITLSALDTDGKIYIENRRGASINAYWTFLR